jgi:hypothetical protein
VKLIWITGALVAALASYGVAQAPLPFITALTQAFTGNVSATAAVLAGSGFKSANNGAAGMLVDNPGAGSLRFQNDGAFLMLQLTSQGGAGGNGNLVGAFTAQSLNYIATENGATNAIATAAAAGPTLTAGLSINLQLAHTLQAGANTFAYNAGSALAIKSHRDPSANIAAIYAATGVISLAYNGTLWLDLSQ